MVEQKNPKFFITHSWRDNDFVQKLANDLRTRGFGGFIDIYSVKPGDDIPAEINRGLGACDVYIPILSSESLRSKWCEREINAALMLSAEPERRGTPRIIPILADDCRSKLPPLLKPLRYINFTGRYDEAIRELLKEGFGLDLEEMEYLAKERLEQEGLARKAAEASRQQVDKTAHREDQQGLIPFPGGGGLSKSALIGIFAIAVCVGIGILGSGYALLSGWASRDVAQGIASLTPKYGSLILPTIPLPTLPLKPTDTPLRSVTPTMTLIISATATLVPPQATAKQEIDVRQGPGTQFAIAGRMPANTSAAILGKSEDGKWLQVAFPDAAHPAWIPGEFVTATGTIDQLPIVTVAPPPTPTRGTVVVVATQPPAATPTQAFPPARGSMGFVVYDAAQNSYLLYNLGIEPRSYASSGLLGPAPFDLAQNTNAVPFAMAPNSARVAYVFSTSNMGNALRVTDPSNPDAFADIVSHQGISSPTFSPDGTTIAYIGLDKAGVDYGMKFIYTVPADGGTAQRFFPANQPEQQQRAGEVYRGVAWGKTHLLFASNLTGQFEIWRLNGDGSGPIQLTNDKRENICPAWSPDGKTYAYSSKQVDGSYQIMVANAFDGSAPRKVTNAGHNFSPTFSPDGNWIAFMSSRGGKMDIWVTNKNGSNVQLLTDKFAGQGQMPGGWR